MILARLGDERDSLQGSTDLMGCSLRGFCPWWKQQGSYSSRPTSQVQKTCRWQFFVVVLFLLSQYPIFYPIWNVISLRWEVCQCPDCISLWIYTAQHYRTLQTNTRAILLTQTLLYVPPSVLKCPQKYCKRWSKPTVCLYEWNSGASLS